MSELTVKTGVDASGFETGLNRLQSSVRSFAGAAGGILAGAFAFDKLMSGLNAAIQKGDQLQDLANKFGISASSLQKIGNAAELSGASLESVAAAMNKAAVNAQKAVAGDEALAAGFSSLGLSVENLRAASPEDLLAAFSQALRSGAIAGQEFNLAVQLFGRSATDLIPTLSQDFQALGESMGVMSNQTIANLAAASDALKTFGNGVTLVFANIVNKIMEAVEAYGRFAVIRPIIRFFDDSRASAESVRQRTAQSAPSAGTANFQKERERMDVAEARQELRLIDAGIAGAAAAERVLANLEPEALARPQQAERQAETRSSMQVLADSLQQVGGGGRFAQVGGVETVQRDQLTVLKNIEKNTAKTGATFGGKSYDIGVQ
jgi:hypothetical protein